MRVRIHGLAALLAIACALVPASARAGSETDDFIGDGSLFIKGGQTMLRGTQSHDASGIGYVAGFDSHVDVWRSKYFNGYHDVNFVIGGGDNGLEGDYRERIYLGASGPDDWFVQPYLRVGAGGEYRSNDLFLFTHLDLPAGQVGFATVPIPGLSIDAGLDGGLTLAGRYNTGTEYRRVLDGAPTWGGYAQAQIWPLLARVDYRTYVQDHDAPRPEEWRAHACLILPFIKSGLATGLDACFDGSWMHGVGIANDGTTSDTRATYIGFSIGIGVAGSLSEGADRRLKRAPTEEPLISPAPGQDPTPAAPVSSPATKSNPPADQTNAGSGSSPTKAPDPAKGPNPGPKPSSTPKTEPNNPSPNP